MRRRDRVSGEEVWWVGLRMSPQLDLSLVLRGFDGRHEVGERGRGKKKEEGERGVGGEVYIASDPDRSIRLGVGDSDSLKYEFQKGFIGWSDSTLDPPTTCF